MRTGRVCPYPTSVHRWRRHIPIRSIWNRTESQQSPMDIQYTPHTLEGRKNSIFRLFPFLTTTIYSHTPTPAAFVHQSRNSLFLSTPQTANVYIYIIYICLYIKLCNFTVLWDTQHFISPSLSHFWQRIPVSNNNIMDIFSCENHVYNQQKLVYKLVIKTWKHQRGYQWRYKTCQTHCLCCQVTWAWMSCDCHAPPCGLLVVGGERCDRWVWLCLV